MMELFIQLRERDGADDFPVFVINDLAGIKQVNHLRKRITQLMPQVLAHCEEVDLECIYNGADLDGDVIVTDWLAGKREGCTIAHPVTVNFPNREEASPTWRRFLKILHYEVLLPLEERALDNIALYFRPQWRSIVQSRSPGGPGDALHPRDLYDAAANLPTKATLSELANRGITIRDEPPYPELFRNIYSGHKDGTLSIVMKYATCPEENGRLAALLESQIKHENIIELTCALTTDHGVAYVMPRLRCDLTSLPSMGNAVAHYMWLSMSAALTCLHQHGFAHCDVKESNIGITNDGVFVLIDLASTCRFGDSAPTTKQYVPKGCGKTCRLDWEGHLVASPQADFWMLAVTFYHKVMVQTQPTSWRVNFAHSRVHKKDLLAWLDGMRAQWPFVDALLVKLEVTFGSLP